MKRPPKIWPYLCGLFLLIMTAYVCKVPPETTAAVAVFLVLIPAAIHNGIYIRRILSDKEK